MDKSYEHMIYPHKSYIYVDKYIHIYMIYS